MCVWLCVRVCASSGLHRQDFVLYKHLSYDYYSGVSAMELSTCSDTFETGFLPWLDSKDRICQSSVRPNITHFYKHAQFTSFTRRPNALNRHAKGSNKSWYFCKCTLLVCSCVGQLIFFVRLRICSSGFLPSLMQFSQPLSACLSVSVCPPLSVCLSLSLSVCLSVPSLTMHGFVINSASQLVFTFTRFELRYP